MIGPNSITEKVSEQFYGQFEVSKDHKLVDRNRYLLIALKLTSSGCISLLWVQIQQMATYYSGISVYHRSSVLYRYYFSTYSNQ